MKDKVKKNKKNSLFFAVGIVFLVTILFSWIMKVGTFSGTELVVDEANEYFRLGLHEIFTVSFYSVYYFIIQITFLVVLAGFYGVVSKTKGYQSLVAKLAKTFKGLEIIFVLAVSLLITVFTSISSQVLPVLIFVPFFISIMKEMKMDKIVAFSTTFGAILVGVLGATYGTEVVAAFNSYAGTAVKELSLWKVAILFFSFVSFNAFNVLRLLTTKSKKATLEIEDGLEVEAITTDKKKKVIGWPVAVMFGILAIFVVLGYFNWNTLFNTTVFNDFYTKLMEFTIGDFEIIKYVLGNFAAFGQFALEASIVLLFISSIIIAFIYNTEYVDNFIDGVKNFAKPIILVVFAYAIFVLVYWCQFIPTIVDYFMDSESALAPFLVSICGMIASVFNVDYGYTAYSIGTYFATLYPQDVNEVGLVLTSIYGLASFFVPTSVIMLFGLQYLKISYGEWLKHAWKFLVIMFVILEIIYFIIL